VPYVTPCPLTDVSEKTPTREERRREKKNMRDAEENITLMNNPQRITNTIIHNYIYTRKNKTKHKDTHTEFTKRERICKPL
jgi:hypothetical protein